MLNSYFLIQTNFFHVIESLFFFRYRPLSEVQQSVIILLHVSSSVRSLAIIEAIFILHAATLNRSVELQVCYIRRLSNHEMRLLPSIFPYIHELPTFVLTSHEQILQFPYFCSVQNLLFPSNSSQYLLISDSYHWDYSHYSSVGP